MFDFLIRLSQLALPVFILLTMLNVGLTQEPREIVRYWRDWPFYLKMVIANFVVAPFIMWLLLMIWPLNPDLTAGLAIFSLAAGAPFLIKLTQTSEHDLALGAATMMLLVLGTIITLPLLLPILMPRVSVDATNLTWTLVKQLLLPVIGGALLAYFLPGLVKRIRRWVAMVGNIALYVVLVATIIGYLPETGPIIMSGALVLGVVFVLGATGAGYLAGWGDDVREDIGALATGQRNTAAAMLVATSSFTDPDVFVLITLVNTAGFVMLIAVAKMLKGDNAQVDPLYQGGP